MTTIHFLVPFLHISSFDEVEPFLLGLTKAESYRLLAVHALQSGEYSAQVCVACTCNKDTVHMFVLSAPVTRI